MLDCSESDATIADSFNRRRETGSSRHCLFLHRWTSLKTDDNWNEIQHGVAHRLLVTFRSDDASFERPVCIGIVPGVTRSSYHVSCPSIRTPSIKSRQGHSGWRRFSNLGWWIEIFKAPRQGIE